MNSLGAMAKTVPVHVDMLLVAGLEGDAHLDLQNVVAAQNRPGAAAWQHRALELRSLEAAGGEPGDAPGAIRRVAENVDVEFEVDREQKLGLDLRHGKAPVQPIRHGLSNAVEATS